MNYTPISGSLASDVCGHFRKHPQDTLTDADIAEKFRAPLSDVVALLDGAVKHRFLTRTKLPGVRNHEFAIGPALLGDVSLPPNVNAPAPAARPPMPPAPPRRKSPIRSVLPPLDLATISVEAGVPVPPRTGPMKKGVSRYDELLAKLTEPGLSVRLPVAYQSTVQKSAKTFGKTHQRAFLVRKVSETECRVFRTA